MVKNKHATRAFIAFLVTWSFEARAEDSIKKIAERQATRPIEIAKAILAPGYRPQEVQP